MMPIDRYLALEYHAEVCSVIGLLENNVHTKESTIAATRPTRTSTNVRSAPPAMIAGIPAHEVGEDKSQEAPNVAEDGHEYGDLPGLARDIERRKTKWVVRDRAP
jgi:hypothetical protein